MSADSESLKSSLGLDTTDFKTGLADANRELRVLESGFRASVSTLEDWGNTVTGLETRQKNLTKQIEIQKDKVEALRKNHERLAVENGETSISARNAEVALNKETERLGKMQIELDGTVTGLQNLHDGNDAAGRSMEELAGKQDSLGQQFKRSWTEINSAIMVGKEAWQAINKVVDETVGTYVNYADRVREISQVTGQQAEEVSRLLQVTDDYKIKDESLNTVMKKMASEGYPLTIDSLAKLSDEYLKLNPGVERSLFLNEKFGKQGIDFAEAMLAGGDALRKRAAAVEANLILDQRALDKAREYQIAQDGLNDALEGMKIAVGQELVPILTKLANGLTASITAEQTWQRAMDLGINVRRNAANGVMILNGEQITLEELTLKVAEAEQAQKRAFEEANPEIARAHDYMVDYKTSAQKATTQTDMFGFAVRDGADALQQANAEFGFIINFARQYETNLKNVKTAEKDLKEAEAELFAMSQPGWDGTAEQLQTAQDKVDGLKTKLSEAQQASLDATNEMIAGFLQAQLTADGSFTEEDIRKVLKYRLAMGLLTQEGYDAALAALKVAQNLASIPAEVNTQVNVNTNYTYTNSGGNGGGGGAQYIPMADGGDFIVRRPTLFLAGEAGPERATFTPMNQMEDGVSRLAAAVRDLNMSLPALAGTAYGAAQQSSTTINAPIQANVANDIDLYKLSRQVAEEIARRK